MVPSTPTIVTFEEAVGTSAPRSHGAGNHEWRQGPSRSERMDAAGLRSAFLAHGGELYRYARRSLGDSGAAEDVVQETFMRAWRARERFDPELGTLRTWLFAIIRRLVIDHGRARSVRPISEPAEAADSQVGAHDTDRELEQAMTIWQVEEAILRLRPEHRQVLVDTYYRGRRAKEIAQELGVPEGTVRSRLFYALQSLRLNMDEMGWDA